MICKEFENTDIVSEADKKYKNSINGTHINHNHVDNIWQFTLEDPTISLHNNPIKADMLQILAIDAALNPYVEREDELKNNTNGSKKKRKHRYG